MRTDRNGLPILSIGEIAARAEEFVRYFDTGCLMEPQPTPLGTICTRLNEEFGIPMLFGVPLGSTQEGYKILGQFDFKTRAIAIDESLVRGDPRFWFTLAHELGHLVLHRKIPPDVIHRVRGSVIRDSSHDLALERLQSSFSPGQWLEWQANKFAGALLLPAATVPRAVVNRQDEIGITRGRGRVWVDWRSRATSDLDSMVRHLAQLYQVPRAIVKVRLRELELIVEEAPATSPMRVGSVLRDMLK